MNPVSSRQATNPALVILAAGVGSRYGGPKQMKGVGPAGETILDYSIFDALRAGFGKVVLVVRRDLEVQFRETFVQRWQGHVPMELVFQELDSGTGGAALPEGRTRPWGTGHAVLVAGMAVDGPFAMVNADDFYGAKSFGTVARFLQSDDDADYCMPGYRLEHVLSREGHVSRGICEVDADRFLSRIAEYHRIGADGGVITGTSPAGRRETLPRAQPVSMNMWGFRPSLFGYLQEAFTAFLEDDERRRTAEFQLPTVIGKLIETGVVRVRVVESSDDWFGLTHKDDTPVVQQRIRTLTESGSYPRCLWDVRS